MSSCALHAEQDERNASADEEAAFYQTAFSREV
uniref:Uncharacterized protein n=1 Tax=Rhizophora mucronata TaxID=61149 RepID=A0A2P2MYF1_RHIMU